MRTGVDPVPEASNDDAGSRITPKSDQRSRHRFKLRLNNAPDAIISVLKLFADLGHGPSSLLAIATQEGQLLFVAEFDGLSDVHALILTNNTRRLPGVVDCEAVRLSAEVCAHDG